MRTHRLEDAGRIGAHDAGAQDDHVRRRHTRHAAEQDAVTALVVLQQLGGDGRDHAAGNLAGRSQHRQMPVPILNRLVGDRGDLALEQELDLARVCHGQVQEAAEDLSFLQQIEVRQQRPGDGQEHLRPAVDFLCGIANLRACLAVAFIFEATAGAGVSFDVDAMAHAASGSRRPSA